MNAGQEERVLSEDNALISCSCSRTQVARLNCTRVNYKLSCFQGPVPDREYGTNRAGHLGAR